MLVMLGIVILVILMFFSCGDSDSHVTNIHISDRHVIDSLVSDGHINDSHN